VVEPEWDRELDSEPFKPLPPGVWYGMRDRESRIFRVFLSDCMDAVNFVSDMEKILTFHEKSRKVGRKGSETMAKRLRKGELPDYEYVNRWGKLGSRWYNKAQIRLNGRVFDIRFFGKYHGYRGWYQASLDGKDASKPFSKIDPLLRELDYRYPKE